MRSIKLRESETCSRITESRPIGPGYHSVPNISRGSSADTTDVGRENRLLQRRSVCKLIDVGENKMYNHKAKFYVWTAESCAKTVRRFEDSRFIELGTFRLQYETK